jgi:CNT family concentrative nucleoside transporter
MSRFVPLLGILAFLGFAWLISENRKSAKWRPVLWGMGLQFVLALLVLGIPALNVSAPFGFLFHAANDAFLKLMTFADSGAQFVFGPLVDVPKIGGYIFAFKVLPSIIFFSALMAILYHVGFLPVVVDRLAKVMVRTMGVSGAESLSTAGNVFLGQTEAPLLIRPFVPQMTRSELFLILAGGMANTAGGVLAAYVGLLSGRIPDIAAHLLTMSVLSAPASVAICKLIVPETETPVTLGGASLKDSKIDANLLEAAARGTQEGLTLALNVAAMLISFVALIACLNGVLGWAGNSIGFEGLSLQKIFGHLFGPVAWLLGVPWNETSIAGSFLGEKIVLNEFVAYVSLSNAAATLSDRTVLVTSYALCGFANFSSVGILLGGVGALAPGRRGEMARMGVRAVIGGNLAAFVTACVASFLS